MSHNYALIIGVQEYREYDPSGGADIPGARNDARAWVRSCLAMGFAPQNIRVLATPALSVAELGPGAQGVSLGTADRASIIAGLEWLSEQIGGDTPASGLATFSGHGEQGGDGSPLLCPSDLTPSLEQTIDVGKIRQVTSGRVRGNLTMALDCCHAQVQVSRSAEIQAGLRALATDPSRPSRGRERVISACMGDQESVSARFMGEQMGAFTWALTSTLGQWDAVTEDDVVYLDVSYGDLLTRVRMLLGALSFDQIPVVSGPKGVSGDAFLRPGKVQPQEGTELQPTAPRTKRQLDPGNYQLTNATQKLVAYIIVNATTEDWYMYGTLVGSLTDTKSIDLKQTSTSSEGTPPSGYTSHRTTPADADWTGSSSYAYSNNYLWTLYMSESSSTGSMSQHKFAMSFDLDGNDIVNIGFYSDADVSWSPALNQPYTFYRDENASPDVDYSYDAPLTLVES